MRERERERERERDRDRERERETADRNFHQKTGKTSYVWPPQSFPDGNSCFATITERGPCLFLLALWCYFRGVLTERAVEKLN